ncbi:MAG: bifunctional glutamate N-acetyltransferase/amino-acid acetyltransferase ArgJ [Phycisphaerae bacterium]
MSTTARHITLPKGFVASAVACGIKQSGKPDLAIIAGEKDVSAAIVTTSNQIVGEPIKYCRNVLPKAAGKIRGIVINAGNSNVCTGKRGYRDAERMAELTARQLNTDPQKVLVASTGIIGHSMPMTNAKAGIEQAAAGLGTENDAVVAQAILTTDLVEKTAVKTLKLGGKEMTIAGIAKGSGMIAPSLATMISVITTDAAVSPAALKRALSDAAGATYNAVTVDSDTSTSDIVAVLASGKAGNKSLTTRSDDFKTFSAALREVCDQLARMIVADGEGATRIVEINITGARSDAEAKLAAKSVADSPLLKCAVHGGDPNWGRIAMALGKSNAKVVADNLRIKIGGTTIFSKGTGRKFDVDKVQQHMSGETVTIDCDLGLGKGSFTALTCDLSREYITINADYHT